MRPIQLLAGIAAVSLFAAPLCAAASTPRLQVSPAAAAAIRARELPFLGYAKTGQTVDLLVHLPLRNRSEAVALAAALSTPHAALYHRWLTPAQFAARYAPLRSDMQSAAAWLRAAGFAVGRIDSQFIHVSAPVATVERTFATKMGLVSDGHTVHLDARVPIALPAGLQRLHASVVGLNALPPMYADGLKGPIVRSFKHKMPATRSGGARPDALNGPTGPYYPGELLQAYGEPSYTWAKGYGESIAIVGYSDSSDADNQALWCYYGLGPSSASCSGNVPYPVINHVEFPGSYPPETNVTNDAFVASEVAQMVGGSAPGATIDQYAADAVSSFGFLDAFSYIVNSTQEDIIVTPYSNCELDYLSGQNQLLLEIYDDTFLQGSMQGETWVFSSGDTSNYACWQFYSGAGPTVSAFAADPNVTGVGGTTLLTTSSVSTDLNTTYASESSMTTPVTSGFGTWGSGGGASQIWPTPEYQTAIGLPSGGGRQVPDISMHMGAPNVTNFSSDVVCFDGSCPEAFGTAESAAEFAAWIAEGVTAVNAGVGAKRRLCGRQHQQLALLRASDRRRHDGLQPVRTVEQSLDHLQPARNGSGGLQSDHRSRYAEVSSRCTRSSASADTKLRGT